jgi:hypothetical protein
MRSATFSLGSHQGAVSVTDIAFYRQQHSSDDYCCVPFVYQVRSQLLC